MTTMRSGRVLLPAILALALPVRGEVLTWSADVPFADSDQIEIVLDGLPRGVAGVEFRAFGEGGYQNYWCMVCCDPDGFGGSMPMALDLILDKTAQVPSGSASATVWPYPSPGEWVLPAVPAAGHEDWAFLTDGVFTVTKWGHHDPYPYPFPLCTATIGGVPVAVDRLELTITCDNVVADVRASWGSFKAIYR